MEFEITCPIDGPVKVSLEDIETVVLREPHRAEISFVCPECGEQITVAALVPPFLVDAITALSETGELPEGNPLRDMSELIAELQGQLVNGSIDGYEVEVEPDDRDGSQAHPEQTTLALDDDTAEAYCEYFRRQLEHVGSVDDVLAEIDAGRS
jgi:hypothetical protein